DQQPRRAPPTRGRPPPSQEGTSRALTVAPGAARSAAGSSGASTSRPRPGSTSTRGSSPRARAAERWLSNDGSPKVSGIASGGARAAPLVPSPEREGTNAGRPGVGASARRRISSTVTHGTSPGTGRNAREPG